MKKILALMLALTMLLALAACGGKEDDELEPLPDSSQNFAPPSNDPEPLPSEAQGWVDPGTSDTSGDYLQTAIDDLSNYVHSQSRAHYLGQLKMDNGIERHVFLFRLGQSEDDFNTYYDLTNRLSISSEETTLVALDSSTPAPTFVESKLTNYGTVYVYDFAEKMDINKYSFQHKLATHNDVVDRLLETYTIGIGNMVDITSMSKLRDSSIDIYRLSTNLWALPDAMEFAFVEREINEIDETTNTRMNYSSEITFMVWGNDTVPLTAELQNPSIEAYPYYEIKGASVFQSPVVPYTYTISGFYDEGVVTAEMDASSEYLNARSSIESQFVLAWGDARVPFSASPVAVPIDITTYLPN